MGESAGGGSVTHQITAYGGSRGKVPFQQAIVQSPGYQPMPSSQGQDAVYQKFLEDANVNSLDDARALTAEQLQFANFKLVEESFPYGTFTFSKNLRRIVCETS
jgi:carboxylesterase type B